MTDRWSPARAGILNIWRYHDEILTFDDGRLLLRGPNGSGKSKALEVLLPFLLDANLRPNRLSTFGTSERSMHWNLMGDRYQGATRVGYVWLEFAGPDGYFTCGARLQASRQTTSATADYFTTTRRIGDDLDLFDDEHAPLNRGALAAALGSFGTVYTSAGDYRTAVRRALYPGVSEQRYDALISALLQLRTPKLSERLDPGLVSDLLSRALPPLGQQDIDELAEGFERLDRQREHLKRLDDYVEAAGSLAIRASTYARRVLRAAAQALIGATSTMDQLTRRARVSEEQHQQSLTDLTRLTDQLGAAQQQSSDAAARIEALRDSDLYQEGKQIDELRERVRTADRAANGSRSTAEKRRVTADTAGAAASTAQAEVNAAEGAVRDSRRTVVSTAQRVGLTAAIDRAENALPPVGPARTIVAAAAESRLGQVGDVRKALVAHANAERDQRLCETRMEDAEQAEQRAELQLIAATQTREQAAGEQLRRLRAWHHDLRELVIADVDALLDIGSDELAVRELIGRAAAVVREDITAAETTAKAARDELRAEQAAVTAELEERLHAPRVNPPAPYTRTADRTGRAGNPFWQLVDFAPGVDSAAEPAIEAALQASGLLDAWISPTGIVEPGKGHDTFAVPRERPVARATLADVLVPEPGTEVPAEVVVALLQSVSFGEMSDGEAGIGPGGQWRLATLRGSWEKPDAEYVGATARERARRRRIAELRARLAELGLDIEAVESAVRALLDRRTLIDVEFAAIPSFAELAAAVERVRSAEAAVGAQRDVVASAINALRTAERAAERAMLALTAAAASAGLPADEINLGKIEVAINGFKAAASDWLQAYQDYFSAVTVRDVRSAAHREAELVAEEAAEEADRLAEVAHDERLRLDSVEQALGVPYQEILAQLGDLRRLRETAQQQVKALGSDQARLERRIGELDGARHNDAEKRDDAVRARDAAAESFRLVAESTLAEDAGTTVETTDRVRSTLDAARSVAGRWNQPFEPKDIANSLSALNEEMHRARQTLSERVELELITESFGGVLTAQLDGIRIGASALLRTLKDEREQGQRDITAAEHELFDKTLTGDTRRHLADRIRQATALVDRMNDSLALVRTASDVAVKLVWQVDKSLPEGTREARELLLKDPVRLSESDHAALHSFFRERIDEARQANTAATWEQQLADVFDYTKWHQFVVKLDRANGEGWQDLTKRLHGALSGGEKAIALHLPLFAAVAAHYESEPLAPRLIMLDEVFVGVDNSNRGKVFGLLVALDLDLMLTSDHEWCTYRELPGIAIHQLQGDDDVVTTARFVWTGGDLQPDDDDPAGGGDDSDGWLR